MILRRHRNDEGEELSESDPVVFVNGMINFDEWNDYTANDINIDNLMPTPTTQPQTTSTTSSTRRLERLLSLISAKHFLLNSFHRSQGRNSRGAIPKRVSP
mgnify:FL=1